MDTAHEPRAAYSSSGRVDWFKFISGLLLTSGVAVILAWCLFWALDNGIYLILIAPVIAALPLAGVWYLVLTWSHCRNKQAAVAGSLILGLLLYLGSYEFGLLQIVGVRNAQRIDLLPGYVKFRMKTDVPRAAHLPKGQNARGLGPNAVQHAFNWLFFGAELFAVVGLLVAVGSHSSSRAYCEACSSWMKAETLKLQPAIGAKLWNALEIGRHDHVQALLSSTSRQSAVGCNLTVEHCADCAAQERPQAMYLTVKDVLAPGTHEPMTAKVATLFQPRWSAGLRTLVKQVELSPAEIGAIAASFPGLKGTIDAHPKQFAEAQRTAREIGQAGDATMTDRDRRLAKIKAVEPEDAGRVLTRGNAVMQTIIAIGAIFGGFGLAFAPAILFNLEPKPPDWVFGVATGWMFLWLVLNLFWMLFFPTYFTSRYMLRQTRNAFEYRPSPAVDLKNPDLFFVDIVPRINWGKQMMENASDIGFLELNAAKRELIFEGDRERYWIPAESILEIKHEFWGESVQHALQSSPNLHHLVVVRAMTADGPWETWFSRRQNTFKMRTANRRLADALELESSIRELVQSANGTGRS